MRKTDPHFESVCEDQLDNNIFPYGEMARGGVAPAKPGSGRMLVGTYSLVTGKRLAKLYFERKAAFK